MGDESSDDRDEPRDRREFGPQKGKGPGGSPGPGRTREKKEREEVREKEKMMERREKEKEKEKVRRLGTKPKEVERKAKEREREQEKDAWNKANGWSGGRRQSWRHGRMTDGWLMNEGMRSWQEIQPFRGRGHRAEREAYPHDLPEQEMKHGTQRWKRLKELEEDFVRKEKERLEEKDRDLKVRSEQWEDMMSQMKQMQKLQLGQQELLRGLIQSQVASSTASSSAGHSSGLEQSQPAEPEGGLKKANTKNPP